MKNTSKFIGIIVFAAVIGFTMTGCPEPDPGTNYVPPEDRPVAERWGKWVAEDSTATLEFTVDADGVSKITVGGTAQLNNETDSWGRWKASAQYDYTAKAGESYVYEFEAWTESGTRSLGFQYNTDNVNEKYVGDEVELTTTRTKFIVTGQPLTKDVINHVEFQCADQLGTFYVKMLEIKNVSSPKTLIIQNIPADVYYNYGASGGRIGIFSAGTTPQQALEMTNLVAGAEFSNYDIIITGNGPYTVTIPLYIGSGYIRWTGSGTFDIYVVLNGGGGHYYRAGSVNITSATTALLFSSAVEIFPY